MSSRRTLALVALAMTGTAGCVPKEELDKAAAAARRANAELEKSQSAVQALRLENERVRRDLLARDAAIAAKDDLIGKLRKGNEDLDLALKDMMAKYTKAVEAAKARPIGGVRILPQAMDTALKSLAQANPDLMQYYSEYGMIKLKSDLTFAKGSAEVKPEARGALKKLAEVINSDMAKKYSIYAAGHTDDIPIVDPNTLSKHGSNWGLSVHRAAGVVKELALAGVSQERLGAAGFSKYHPVAPNAPGNKGNPLNRRVELWIVPPDRLLATGPEPEAPKPAPNK